MRRERLSILPSHRPQSSFQPAHHKPDQPQLVISRTAWICIRWLRTQHLLAIRNFRIRFIRKVCRLPIIHKWRFRVLNLLQPDKLRSPDSPPTPQSKHPPAPTPEIHPKYQYPASICHLAFIKNLEQLQHETHLAPSYGIFRNLPGSTRLWTWVVGTPLRGLAITTSR